MRVCFISMPLMVGYSRIDKYGILNPLLAEYSASRYIVNSEQYYPKIRFL